MSKKVTRKMAVVGGQVTIIKQIERVDYIDERTHKFISVSNIQEVGREVDCWEHLGNLAFTLVNEGSLTAMDETIDELCEFFDGDDDQAEPSVEDQVAHDMWKTHVAQVA